MVTNEVRTSEYAKLQCVQAKLSEEQKHCLGTMLGAFVGDAIGAFREFQQEDCPEEII